MRAAKSSELALVLARLDTVVAKLGLVDDRLDALEGRSVAAPAASVVQQPPPTKLVRNQGAPTAYWIKYAAGLRKAAAEAAERVAVLDGLLETAVTPGTIERFEAERTAKLEIIAECTAQQAEADVRAAEQQDQIDGQFAADEERGPRLAAQLPIAAPGHRPLTRLEAQAMAASQS